MWVVLCAALLLCACGGRVAAPVDDRADEADRPDVYIVQRGDTLYSIAWRYGHDYRDVARWNGIAPPYTIYPRQRLRLRPPAGGGRAQASAEHAPGPQSAARRAPVRASRSGPRRTVRDALEWGWPAAGPLLRRFDGDGPGKKGISIGGRPGAEVRAAADGRVVYSGSGLIGYGKLIIIKHNKKYLSAYGHNRKVLVEEGEDVRKGQRIAELGSTGSEQPMVHFEIRRDGKPTDPLRYLPPR